MSEVARQSILRRVATGSSELAPKLPDSATAPGFLAGEINDWKKRLEAMHAQVTEIGSESELHTAVIAQLEEWGLAKVALAPDEVSLHNALRQTHKEVTLGVADSTVPVSIARAYAGFIESGSLVLLSSPDTAVRNAFLPEYSVLIIQAHRIVPTLESVWALMHEEGREMPRTMNIITGPSKTADIEQTIVYGAHGPKVLQVFLIREQLIA